MIAMVYHCSLAMPHNNKSKNIYYFIHKNSRNESWTRKFSLGQLNEVRSDDAEGAVLCFWYVYTFSIGYKSEIIKKKNMKQRRGGVPEAKMAVPTEGRRLELLINAKKYPQKVYDPPTEVYQWYFIIFKIIS